MLAVRRQETRRYRDLLDDREAVVVLEARAEQPAVSATEFHRVAKIAVRMDSKHAILRDALNIAQFNEDSAEASVKDLDRELTVLVARMTELGGLLTFYAAVKTASVKHPQQQHNTSDTSDTSKESAK